MSKDDDPKDLSGAINDGDPEPLSSPNDLTRKIAAVPKEDSTPPTETLGTEEMGPASDVYVILPEGEEANVPIVETEVVEDEENVTASSNTEVLGEEEGEEAQDVASTGGVDGTSDEAAPEAPDNLEDLATELDDELLVGAEDSRAAISVAKRGAPRSRDFLKEEEDLLSAGKSSRSKVLLSVAALFLMGLAAFLFYPQWKGYLGLGEPSNSGLASHGQASAGGVPLAASGASGASGAQGAKTPGAGPTSTGPGQMVATAKTPDLEASKEAFREKFLLAIELGYVGEVGNE